MPTLVERTSCPVCDAGQTSRLIDLPYDQQPISSYLESFYGGRLDIGIVKGQRYVLEHCENCRLIFQRFAPGPKLLDTLYGSVALADRQEVAERRGLYVRQIYSHQVERFIKFWGRDPASLRVLDFGAGTGLWLGMVEAYGCETHAADLEPSHIEHLRARGVRAHPVEALPSNTFHYINAEQVFEHLVSPMDVIQRLADSLVPGGLLRVGVPNGSGIESLLVNPDWAAPKGSARSLNAIAPLEHLNCYTRDTLVVLGQQAALRPFEYPFKQFMQPLERSRFVLSAFVHLVRRPTGTSPIVFQRSV